MGVKGFTPFPEPIADRFRVMRSGNQRLAIFVHGLFRGHLNQWYGFHNTLAAHASSDPILSTWNYLFLGYASTRIRGYREIAELIGTQCRRAANGTHDYDDRHVEFAFIGFSLGTLGIREYVANCALQPPDTTIKGIGLYGTPLIGSSLADAAMSFVPRRIFEQLSTRSTSLRMLRDWSRCSYKSHGFPKNPRRTLKIAHLGTLQNRTPPGGHFKIAHLTAKPRAHQGWRREQRRHERTGRGRSRTDFRLAAPGLEYPAHLARDGDPA